MSESGIGSGRGDSLDRRSTEATTSSSTGNRWNIKNLFRSNREPQPGDTTDTRTRDIGISLKVWQQLSAHESTDVRMSALKNVGRIAGQRSLDCDTLDALWNTTSDLLDCTDRSTQTETIDFYRRLGEHHFARMTVQLRAAQFYKIRDKVMAACNPTSVSTIEQSTTIGGHPLKRETSGTSMEQSDQQLVTFAELFAWLNTLTNAGAETNGFEEDALDLCIIWTRHLLLDEPKYQELADCVLRLLCSLIEHNGLHIQDVRCDTVIQVICAFTLQAVDVAQGSSTPRTMTIVSPYCNLLDRALDVLERVVAHGIIEDNGIQLLTHTLARLVMAKMCYQRSWRLARNMFSSHMGFVVIDILCALLETGSNPSSEQAMPPIIIQGAIVLLNMALWSSQRIDALTVAPSAVLPYLDMALECDSHAVAIEVLICVDRLVRKFGSSLQLLTWNVLLQIMDRVHTLHIVNDDDDVDVASVAAVDTTPAMMQSLFNAIVTEIEVLHSAQQYGGPIDRMFALIERCADIRPEQSVVSLLSYRAAAISVYRNKWLDQLAALMDRYYLGDNRLQVRVKALAMLRAIFESNHVLHGTDIADNVVLVKLENVATECDFQVQHVALQLLCDIVLMLVDTRQPTHGTFDRLIATLNDAVAGHLETIHVSKGDDGQPVWTPALRQCLENCQLVTSVLRSVLQRKWSQQPPDKAINVYKVMVDLLLSQYEQDLTGEIGGELRKDIIDVVFSLRCHPVKHSIGVTAENEQIVYSSFISCAHCADEHGDTVGEGGEQQNAQQQENINLLYRWHDVQPGVKDSSMGSALLTCLKRERYWPALYAAFANVSQLLCDRHVLMSSRDSISELASSLVQLVCDSRAQQLINTTHVFTAADMCDNLCPLFATLFTYQDDLDAALQLKLVMITQEALVSDKSIAALVAITQSLLELPDVVKQCTADLVRRLSELPCSPIVSIALLELLSTLVEQQSLYSDFDRIDHLHVCETLCRYMDVQRYTTFIVAHAKRTLCRWFVKIPMKWRPYISRQVVIQLRSMKQLDKTTPQQSMTSLRSDSTAATLETSLHELHTDMLTCMEAFLRHYTFTNRIMWSKLTNDELTSNGNQQTQTRHWFTTDSVVTVSTWPIKVARIRHSYDADHVRTPEADWTHSHNSIVEHEQKLSLPQPSQSDDSRKVSTSSSCSSAFSSSRRRHVSAIQQRTTTQSRIQTSSAKDDTYIRNTAGDVDDELPATPTATPIAYPHQHQSFFGTDHVSPTTTFYELVGHGVRISIRHAYGAYSWSFTQSLNEDQLYYQMPDLTNGAQHPALTADLSLDSGPPLTPDPSDVMGDVSRHSSFSTHSAPPCPSLLARRQPPSIPPLSVNTRMSAVIGSDAPRSACLFQNNTAHSHSTASTPLHPELTEEDLDPVSAFIRYLPCMYDPCPMIVPRDKHDVIERALRNLDRIEPCEVQTIGVCYVSLGQTHEQEILANEGGSQRYRQLLAGLGTLCPLRDADPQVFIGGLSRNGKDGEYTYVWSDSKTQICWHCATLMPSAEGNAHKKRHIGNDLVVLVYNDSGQTFKPPTISGQCVHVIVELKPTDTHTLHVNVHCKDEIARWLALKHCVVRDEHAAALCRQLCVRATMSAQTWRSHLDDPSSPHVSHAVSRLRLVRAARQKCCASHKQQQSSFIDWLM